MSNSKKEKRRKKNHDIIYTKKAGAGGKVSRFFLKLDKGKWAEVSSLEILD